MPVVHTDWWCIEIPDEWSADHDDDVVSIVDCDHVGAIDITAVKKESGMVQEQDLKDFAEELIDKNIEPIAIKVGENDGLYFEYQEERAAWREWYLGSHSTLVYVTYNTDIENAEIDKAVVDQILSTLLIADFAADAAQTGRENSD